jgi:hypothetical protein
VRAQDRGLREKAVELLHGCRRRQVVGASIGRLLSDGRQWGGVVAVGGFCVNICHTA